jgi:ice-binding like protein/Big-like domain-containing protein
MRKLMVSKIWIPAFLLAAVVAGCGDSDKAAGSGNPLALPTVASVTPPTGSAVVCPNTPVVTATFSKAMNPLTINTATFTLADPSGASVAGTVSLDSTGLVATFTPMNALAVRTTFTATITTGAMDTFGNTLAANFTWTFTTSPFNPCPPPVGAVTLGAACGYGILGGSTVTTTGNTHVTGDVGLSPGSAMTGWATSGNTFVGTGTDTNGPGLVTGVIHITDPPPPAPNTAAAAQTALTAAYLDLSGRTAPAPTTITPTDIGGRTLAPGIWKSASTVQITGDVTLDGGGDVNAIWIFQVGSFLTVNTGSHVVLAGGASAHNIFWTVGSGATLGTTSIFNGSILSNTGAITLNTGAVLNGRALQSTPGAVTLQNNAVTVPPCP